MKALLTTALSGAFAAGAWAADAQPAAPETEAAKLNYSLGYQIGQDFKRQGVELSADVVTRGVDDALSGAEPALAPLEMRNILRQLKRKIVAQQAAKV
jgi:FKBP-type peptidyl-prolyl cis-trans isomerase FklB